MHRSISTVRSSQARGSAAGTPLATRSEVSRLRDADSFVEVAHAILSSAPVDLGASGGAVEALDAGGRPVVCVASDWIGDDWPRLYLELGHRLDPCLEQLRDRHWPLATADVLTGREAGELAAALAAPDDLYRHGIVGPLVGDDALIGVVRLAWSRPPPPRALVEVAALCAHASVRLARIGFPGAAATSGFARLTARQLEVSGLVARGYTNAEVAIALAISTDAVKKHVRHLLATLAVANRTELAALVARTAPTLDACDPVPLPGVRVARAQRVARRP
jgi:DNA-binding CsgD family transcriptional regulator